VAYRHAATLGTQRRIEKELRGIAVGRDGRILAVGDSRVVVFDAAGGLLREWSSERPGYCVAEDEQGRIWVGEFEQVEIFDEQGRLLETWRDAERLGLVTAIGFTAEAVLLGDATARWIHRYDRQGEFLNEIGKQHRKGGFHIPNGVVDFVVDGDEIIHVANPGMHRVERYRADGEYLGHFGRFDGRDPAGFPGCCNPTNLALDRSGRVVVSEKAAPRVKLYDAEGALLQVIAVEGFAPDAKNMDLAVDDQGRLYVADNVRCEIHRYAPAQGEVQP
jgi:sugar lactone lactonase YvrE